MAGTDKYVVYISVPDEQVEAIRTHAPDVIAPEQYGLITELEGDNELGTELAVEVAAADADDAVRQAQRLYAAVRRSGGLRREVGQVVGLNYAPGTSVFPPNPHVRLLAEADELMKRGAYHLAILQAHTALEVYGRDALEGALARHFDDRDRAEALVVALRKTDLHDDRVRALIGGVTGYAVTEARWWSQYEEHRKRRNAIVHRGFVTTATEAKSSLRVVRDAITLWQEIWAGQITSGERPAASP